jgi:hypothetical protein
MLLKSRRKELERLRPQPTEYSRCKRRINQAIEKMFQRDHPASAVPNRFLDVAVDRIVNRRGTDAAECGPHRVYPRNGTAEHSTGTLQ